MSLGHIAKELGIGPACLSYMLNTKRPWRKGLYQRYMGVVDTFVNSEEESVNKDEIVLVVAGAKKWSGRRDSNSRHPPWQGGALPLSHFRSTLFRSNNRVHGCSSAPVDRLRTRCL